jgi:L-serine dehydratase
MGAITTSIFDIFKIGPGPSSSHTIGPMKAGYEFLQSAKSLPADSLRDAEGVEVTLYGSLAATGRGHGTDRAVLGGLLGLEPETCPPGALDELLGDAQATYEIALGDRKVPMRGDDIIFKQGPHDFPFSNTLVISLKGRERAVFERRYYSVGGGFIQWEGQPVEERGVPVYPYENAGQLKACLAGRDLDLHELVLENEKAITGRDEARIGERLDAVLDTMERAVERGLKTQGILPGPIGLHRKAADLFERAGRLRHIPDHFMAYLGAYAFAVSEENAAGHPVVTAPTCGSAGIIPATVYVMKHHLDFSPEAIRKGLLAASAVAFLAKCNASLAGADVGCQGEVGVASSMAAAMLAYADTFSFQTAENAAETALEHHLGLTCDPVGGYVQIPCIERNAMGAIKAYMAYLIAKVETARFHVISLDTVIEAMARTGHDMNSRYRETSEGGLAALVKC